MIDLMSVFHSCLIGFILVLLTYFFDFVSYTNTLKKRERRFVQFVVLINYIIWWLILFSIMIRW